jgi:hypothetical protein
MSSHSRRWGNAATSTAEGSSSTSGATTASSSGNLHNNNPSSSSVGKQLSQQGAALKMKAISQLRQVLRSSPNRGALAFTLGKDILIVLRYLPVGIMNKMQQIAGSMEMSSNSNDSSKTPSSSTSSQNTDDKNNSASHTADATAKAVPSSEAIMNNNNKDAPGKKTIAGAEDHVSMKPTMNLHNHPIQSAPSVLRNILEINSQNNRVIYTTQTTTLKAVSSSSSTATAMATATKTAPLPMDGKDVPKEVIPKGDDGPTLPDKLPPPEDSKNGIGRDEHRPRILKTNLMWHNIEMRSKYLVICIQKCLDSDSSSKHNLTAHLDDLFSHIYQHHETRLTAIQAGAIKTLTKVVKTHTNDSYVTHRAREILGLLGINPSTKGKGIKILSIDGGGVRYKEKKL